MTTISTKDDVITLINVFTVEQANQRRLIELNRSHRGFGASGAGLCFCQPLSRQRWH